MLKEFWIECYISVKVNTGKRENYRRDKRGYKRLQLDRVLIIKRTFPLPILSAHKSKKYTCRHTQALMPYLHVCFLLSRHDFNLHLCPLFSITWLITNGFVNGALSVTTPYCFDSVAA